MRILLALFICIYGFGADVCEMIDFKEFEYLNKYLSNFDDSSKNNQLLDKAFLECKIQNNKKATKINKSACLYIYKNFVSDQRWDTLKSLPDVVLALIFTQTILMEEDNKNDREVALVMSSKVSELIRELLDFGLKEAKNKDAINNLKLLEFLSETNNFTFSKIKFCPLYHNGKLQSDKIDMPCACKKSTAFLLKPDTIRQAFLNLKLLCDKYKDRESCGAVGGLYENGQGVRIDFKQAKKYYGLACDYGYQFGCDGYKRLMAGGGY
ncbi:SEL1-like repeat protein [Campylobacter sp. RM9939]|uniref:SEL1-like repeat protein n=1 Tax=Campylobacter molothri TaxID=1032242 RepID=UPI00301B9131|nr:SEL1-like repeat protein [Campylobacter sp. RM9939]